MKALIVTAAIALITGCSTTTPTGGGVSPHAQVGSPVISAEDYGYGSSVDRYQPGDIWASWID